MFEQKVYRQERNGRKIPFDPLSPQNGKKPKNFKQRDNWFDKMVKEIGQDFMNIGGPRIFNDNRLKQSLKDFARGNLKKSHEHFICNNEYLTKIMLLAHNESLRESVEMTALEGAANTAVTNGYDINNPQSAPSRYNALINLIQEHKDKFLMWATIFNLFSWIRDNAQLFQTQPGFITERIITTMTDLKISNIANMYL